MPISAYIRFVPQISASSRTITITIGSKTATTTAITSTIAAYASVCNALFEDSGMTATAYAFDDEIQITSPYSIEIIDGTVIHREVSRGNESSMLKIIPVGSNIYLGQPFYAMPKLEAKFTLANIQWQLYDAITNELLDTQHSWIYRHILLKRGTYTLSMRTIDAWGENLLVKTGFVLV
jgi:hypothetical protein